MNVTERLEQLELTDSERNLLAGGYCPKCKVPMRGQYVAVPKGMHFLAPEIYATLRDRNIDTSSGHRYGCPLLGIRLP